MEKVKITVEQEKAFKHFVSLRPISNGEHLEIFVKEEEDEIEYKTSSLKALNDITSEQFSHLLNNWYEVEQPFEVGDWLYDGMCYVKIEKFSGEHVLFKGEDWDFINNLDDCYEKVTESWKIKLLELGRENPEFRVGDIYVTDKYNVTRIKETSCLDSIKGVFNKDQVVMFFPVERGIEVKG